MSRVVDVYTAPSELVLGRRLNNRVPNADQKRQRVEVDEILRRLRTQPGIILADEVGMGKTFVALAVAYGVATRSPRGPVVVMVPANLVDKWEQDLKTFCDLYLEGRTPVRKGEASRKELIAGSALRYGVARHSVDLMKLLDDRQDERCHLIFLAQGAMGRRQTDKWIRLALIAEALRRHGRGKASRLIMVKKYIHRFLAELLWAIGEERAHGWGEKLWQDLLHAPPAAWKDIYNREVKDERRVLLDDPVPKSVSRALGRIDVSGLAEALKQMPVRARGGSARVSDRIGQARNALRDVEDALWKNMLARAKWRSPLLVMDEAHHLKNPRTLLARQLQSPDMEHDLRTGDGAMANAFDRMLFLTATPFQLGHHELVRVLDRFGDVRWDERTLGSANTFHERLVNLGNVLTESQRTAIALQRSWARLRPEDCVEDAGVWWSRITELPRESLTSHQRAVVDAYKTAKRCRDAAEEALRPWVLRHNKGEYWVGTGISRRERVDGAPIAGGGSGTGLPIPPDQLLPFFLAARSAVDPGKDLLGEALSSSYEAFRLTRENRVAERDEQEEDSGAVEELSRDAWYLGEFDRALQNCTGATHPKVAATVRKAVDLWEAGEKVLIFAFYRHTCRALRIHISEEIERRIAETARRRIGERTVRKDESVDRLLERIQDRYFDDSDTPGRRAMDSALQEIISRHAKEIASAGISEEQTGVIREVMRRFLRVATTLVRCFPIAELDSIEPPDAVAQTLDHADLSGLSWSQKFHDFIAFLIDSCSPSERTLYLEAANAITTGDIRVHTGDVSEGSGGKRGTLANIQEATGGTRRDARARSMRAFNTPFFPDIFVCSEVMGEGVDLQRFCRHVIHHDLAWNPSSIEQRTGRIDRLGCKAEGRQPIMVYLPYLAGTADERQYCVMSDREQWFRVVMGQDEVAKLIAPDSATVVPLPNAIPEGLSFRLGLCE